jgi:hypothetical protein
LLQGFSDGRDESKPEPFPPAAFLILAKKVVLILFSAPEQTKANLC